MLMNNSSHFIGCSQQRWAWPRGNTKPSQSTDHIEREREKLEISLMNKGDDWSFLAWV